ncbi:MAG: tyrosine-type recombinase/integrase [Bacteroidetes bacterium]|jgi:integrase/recombinase XerC|nr:tyrosine-type recombinase/integrase [Bacteroidota bacterium]
MIQKFLDHLLTEKRYSNNTIISYSRDLKDFELFLLKSEGIENLCLVNKKMVRNFMMALSEKELSKRSINRKISSLRSYYSFLLKINEIAVSPIETIESLKFYPSKQIPMSEDEMVQLQEILDENIDYLSKTIIETLYQTGIRRAELCNLLYQNVDLQNNEIKVIGKGNKTRLIPISDSLKKNFLDYLTIRQPNTNNKDWFFINKNGKKLTEKFVYLKVSSYLGLVTFKEKKSPHMLRHSFATHVLNNGAEISKVQKILGHASLASTQVYTNANIEQLKKIYNKAHPRATGNNEKTD